MATVFVDLRDLDSKWSNACRKAETELNALFKHNGIGVVLTTKGPQTLTITVITDPGIQGTAVHGRTSAETDSSGRMVRSTIRLPVNVTISTPGGIRDAGMGPFEVIAAHEFVHALGHEPHNSLLMTQTWNKEPGDTAAGDILRGNGAKMPPLKLSPESISILQGIWP
jgi:hypothetical protein